jgi:hypothetical protein
LQGKRVTEEEILATVSNTFRSVWTVELLLRLHQEAHRAWPTAGLVRELRASVSAVDDGLADLRKLGLLAVDQQGAYRLQAGSDDMDAFAQALCELYNRKPRAVMRAILAGPNDKIQTFANAFRLRKDPC